MSGKLQLILYSTGSTLMLSVRYVACFARLQVALTCDVLCSFIDLIDIRFVL